MLAVISTYLNTHPYGVTTDYIWTHILKIDSTITKEQVRTKVYSNLILSQTVFLYLSNSCLFLCVRSRVGMKKTNLKYPTPKTHLKGFIVSFKRLCKSSYWLTKFDLKHFKALLKYEYCDNFLLILIKLILSVSVGCDHCFCYNFLLFHFPVFHLLPCTVIFPVFIIHAPPPSPPSHPRPQYFA